MWAHGINQYAVTTSSTAPTSGWTSITATTSLGNTTVDGLVQNTTYYVWVKDQAGNVSAAKSVNTLVAVAQIGTTLYASLQGAIDAVPANNVQTVVTLLTDTTESIGIAGGKNVYLNLNGKVVTGTQDYAIYNDNNATLTLSGGTVIGNSIAVINSGTTVMVSGILQNCGATIFSTTSHIYWYGMVIDMPITSTPPVVFNTGVFSMTGGTIYASGEALQTTGTNARSYVSNSTLYANYVTVFNNNGGITSVSNSVIHSGGAYVANTDGNSSGIVFYNCSIPAGEGVILNQNIARVYTTTAGSEYQVEYFGNLSANRVDFCAYWTADFNGTKYWYTTTLSTNAIANNGKAWVAKINKSNHLNHTGAYTTLVYITPTAGATMTLVLQIDTTI